MKDPLIPFNTPLTISTARYEYLGNVELPKNDTLVWLDEEMETAHESGCCADLINED